MSPVEITGTIEDFLIVRPIGILYILCRHKRELLFFFFFLYPDTTLGGVTDGSTKFNIATKRIVIGFGMM